jgi:hypothetical protein
LDLLERKNPRAPLHAAARDTAARDLPCPDLS